jgi:hypothetical protein
MERKIVAEKAEVAKEEPPKKEVKKKRKTRTVSKESGGT